MKYRVFIAIFLFVLMFSSIPRSTAVPLDSDYDGISDDDELNGTFGWYTDPYNWDTDHDSVSDYEEIFTHSTNPTYWDSDYDHISDGDEILYGGDPNYYDPDTDGDGNIDGYENILGTDPIDYTSSTDMYVSDWDTDGLSDYEEFYSYYTNFNAPDTDTDGLFDGEEVNVVYGYYSNPNLNDTDYDGLSDFDEVINYGSNPGAWDSDADQLGDYDEIFTYFTNPVNNDTDYDLVPDFYEVYYYGTDPNDYSSKVDLLSLDSDVDGLSDYNELYIYHSNPFLVDSDYDSFTDPEEVAQGSDPSDSRDVPVVADGWETTDDTSAGATLIGYGSTSNHSMHVTTDVDWFKFYVSAPISLHILVTSTYNPDTTMYLYEEADLTIEIAYNDDYNSLLSYLNVNVTVGYYYIKMVSFANSYKVNNYRLNLMENGTDSDGDGLANFQELLDYDTDPYNWDSDGDYLSDGEEVNAVYGYYSNPNLNDTDYDGLSDYDEVIYHGTNPDYWDSDNDGYSDADEVAFGSDPLDYYSIPVFGDIYESDDSWDTANAIDLNSATPYHSIHSSTDVDRFYFDLTESVIVKIETNGDSSYDTYMELYNSSLSLIASDDDSGVNSLSRIEIQLSAGRYYVAISGYLGSIVDNYYVSLQTSSIPTTTTSNLPTSTTSSRSSDPSSEPTSTSDPVDNSNSEPALPVPISIVPVMMSFLALSMIQYRRKN